MAGTRTAKRTAEAWKARRRHNVMLPSGFEVELEIPNLPQMVKTGQIPNNLVQTAIGAMSGEVTLTPEILAEQADFYVKLILMTVKSPELTEEDLTGPDPIPFEDQELIVQIATRERDIDALGEHIGGLHTSKQFRDFRGLDYLDANVEVA